MGGNMSEYNLLLGGLRERAKLAAQEGNMTATCDARYFSQAADALEAMAGEVRKYKKEWMSEISANVDLATLAAERRVKLEAAEAERDRLKAVGQKLLAKFDHPTASVTQWDVDELRKALGGDA